MKFSKHLVFVLSCLAAVAVAVFFRLFQLGAVPIAPYWEEVAVAYDAYSILQTGRDHHGQFLPVVALQSFGDWKPAGYAYAQIPSIALFGLSTFALRLPAALSGISLVVLVGFLSWKITNSKQAGILGLFVAAVSSWQIMFSRAGWEVMLATALFCWGAILVTFSFGAPNKRATLQVIAGTVLLWLSAYSYHAMRVLVPLLLGSFVLQLAVRTSKTNWLKNMVGKVWLLGALSIVFMIPFLLAWGSPILNQRFAETSIFSDISVIEQSNAEISQAQYSILARVFSHRYLLFGRVLLDKYLGHFSPEFLFTTGDSNPRHATGYGGQLYLLDAVFLLFGLLYVSTKGRRGSPWVWLTACFVLLSPLPASVTQATPHALRALPMSVGLLVVIAVGAEHLITLVQSKIVSSTYGKSPRLIAAICLVIAIGVYAVQPMAWWRHYTTVYAQESASEWQYGYAELIASLQHIQTVYPRLPVYVSREYGRPAMYLWFYSKTDPRTIQALDDIVAKDQGEFVEFENYTFVRSVSEVPPEEAILALPASKTPAGTVLHTVYSPAGEAIWHILHQEQN